MMKMIMGGFVRNYQVMAYRLVKSKAVIFQFY